jgi:cytochrome c-type biogenesis protein CcmE
MVNSQPVGNAPGGSRVKFWIGGLLIVAAIVYLIASSTSAAAQYYMTIDEVQAQGAAVAGRNLKVSGAVDGATIVYDMQSLTLRFSIANVSGDMDEIEKAGGLAEVLHQAVVDPAAARMRVVYIGPQPDLLRNEAQAIVTGQLGDDGIFYADELLLKCPTRYEEAVPAQAAEG